MYLTYNGVDYPCECKPAKTMAYRGLPEDFPFPTEGEIVLCEAAVCLVIWVPRTFALSGIPCRPGELHLRGQKQFICRGYDVGVKRLLRG